MAEDKNKTTGSNQESNQNWDDQNDQQRSGNQEPNPERYKQTGGSAFNEEGTATGYGSNQRKQEGNVAPLDADTDDLPSENQDRKDLGNK